MRKTKLKQEIPEWDKQLMQDVEAGVKINAGLARKEDFYPCKKSETAKSAPSKMPDGAIPDAQTINSCPEQAHAAFSNIRQPPLTPSQIVTPGMYWQPRAPVLSATTEELDVRYIFNDIPFDTETPKNALRIGLAEYFLEAHSEDKSERARYFPTCTDVVIPNSNGYPPLKFDDLFELPAIVEKFRGHPDFPLIEQLAFLPAPLLRVATKYDLNNASFNERSLLGKARQILMLSGINVENPYKVNTDSMTILAGRYRIAHFAVRPFYGMNILHDSGGQVYAYLPVGDKNAYIPMCCVSRANTGYIRPLALPHKQYQLIGVGRLKLTDVKTIVVTPDPAEVFLNAGNPSIAVVSWVGGLDAIEAVDFSPLCNRQVYYAWNPASFGGDTSMCSNVFNAVFTELMKKQCNVGIMERKETSLNSCTMPVGGTVSLPNLPPAFECPAFVSFPSSYNTFTYPNYAEIF